MRKLLLLFGALTLTLTACSTYDDSELVNDIDRLSAENNTQMTQISDLNARISALETAINAELSRLGDLIAELDRRNLSLADNIQVVQAELNAAVIMLSTADESNLTAALTAVANAETSLANAIESNVEQIQEALAALGAVDTNILAQLDSLLASINTLRSDLNSTDVNLAQAIADADDAIAAANNLIQENTSAIAMINSRLSTVSSTLAGLDYVNPAQLTSQLSELNGDLMQSIAAGDAGVTQALEMQLTSLEERVVNVEVFNNNIMSLTSSLTTLNNLVSNNFGLFTSAVERLEGDIAAAQLAAQAYADDNDADTVSDHTAIQNQINDLLGRVDGIDSSLMTINTSIETINGNIGTLQTANSGLGELIEATRDNLLLIINSDNEYATTNIRALQQRITTLNEFVMDNAAAWAVDTDTTLSMADILAAIDAAVDAIPSDDDSELEEAIAELRGLLSSLSDNVSANTASIEAILAQVQANSDAIAALTAVSASYDDATGILTITYADGSSYSTGDLRGEQGIQGAVGAVGLLAHKVLLALKAHRVLMD